VWISVAFGTETKLRFQLWRDGAMTPFTEGNPFSPGFRQTLVDIAREYFNEPGKPDAVPNIKGNIDAVSSKLGAKGDDGKSIQDKIKEQAGGSITEQLITLGQENAKLFHTPEKVAHAACTCGDHIEVYQLDTKDFRIWLRSEWRRTEREKLEEVARNERDLLIEVTGAMAGDLANAPLEVARPPAIPPQAITTAVGELDATALLEGPRTEVNLRVAEHITEEGEKQVLIDLCNDEWEWVEVRNDGWDVRRGEPPVRFVRSNAMLPLPYPTRDGSVEDLKKIVNLPKRGAEKSWSLILAWLVQALSPCGGDYPILVLLGGHGTGKTTLVELFRKLVDPAVVEHEHEKSYHELKTLYIEVVSSWVLAVDNVSQLPNWLSDSFCRIASGAGFKPRTLFTDRDQQIFRGKRPIVMDGISEVVRKSDILDRTLLIDVPPISGSRRKYEEQVWAEFGEYHAGILGALLDAVSAGLANKDSVVLEDKHKSRLIDFDRWAVATEAALGMKPGTYVKAREDSRRSATTKALESEPIWVPLDTLARQHTQMRPWQGTHKQLLSKLGDLEENKALKRSKEWPKTPEKLRAVLREVAGELEEHGVHWQIDEDGSRRHGQPYKLWADADA
jgi:hypothetical protein